MLLKCPILDMTNIPFLDIIFFPSAKEVGRRKNMP